MQCVWHMHSSLQQLWQNTLTWSLPRLPLRMANYSLHVKEYSCADRGCAWCLGWKFSLQAATNRILCFKTIPFFFFLILLIVLEKRDKKQKMKIKSNISRLCILTTILTTNFVFCQAIAKLLTKWRRVFRLLYRKVCRVWNLWHYFWSTQTFLA